MAARIAALGIKDETVTPREKEARRRASVRISQEAMKNSKQQPQIDGTMKRMMKGKLLLSFIRAHTNQHDMLLFCLQMV